MKLHLGPPPQSPEFSPESQGWTALREPSPLVLNIVAGPMGILSLLLIGWGWSVTATTIEFRLPGANPFAPLIYLSLSIVIGFPVLIVVHEMIHALGYPRCGWTPATIIGFWPKHCLFYAAYLESLGRNHLLVVYLLPFLVISALPLVVCHLWAINSPVLMVASMVNALCCGGDFTCFGLILWQVPSKARVRNQGWATWWKQDQ